MPKEYNKAISEIKASEELKQRIRENVEKERIKENSKGGFFMKMKKSVSTIIAIITALLCGGIVFATIRGLSPANDESVGIKFSENYMDYEDEFENGPFVEKDGARIELKSTVADSGFVILKFNVKLNEEQTKGAEENEGGLYYLSFNDEITENNGIKELRLSGANYNLIIDGEKYWIRPGSNQTVKPIIENKEYEVYQMWFLSNELEGKDEFKITLNDVVMCANAKLLKFDDNFEIELSKKKALDKTKTITGNDETVNYKKVKQSIKNVKVTPLQNIVELSTVYENVSIENLTYLLDEDYSGNLEYKVFDQNGNELVNYPVPRSEEIIYEDGTKEMGEPGDLEFSRQDFKNANYFIKEYIAIEANENINNIKIEVYSKNDYYETITKIGNYEIDLKNQKIKTTKEKEFIVEKINNEETEELMTSETYQKTNNVNVNESDVPEYIILDSTGVMHVGKSTNIGNEDVFEYAYYSMDENIINIEKIEENSKAKDYIFLDEATIKQETIDGKETLILEKDNQKVYYEKFEYEV